MNYLATYCHYCQKQINRESDEYLYVDGLGYAHVGCRRSFLQSVMQKVPGATLVGEHKIPKRGTTSASPSALRKRLRSSNSSAR